MNGYYTPTGNPAIGSQALSTLMRGEFISISAAFDLLPTMLGHGGMAVVVNALGTALTTTVGQLALAGNLATTGAFDTIFAQQASVTLTLPGVTGTLADLTDVAAAVAVETARATAAEGAELARALAAEATELARALAAEAGETARALAAEATLVLPVASLGVLGGVMVDGTTIVVTPEGIISTPGAISVAQTQATLMYFMGQL